MTYNAHDALEQRIAYRFNDRALLNLALTHRSFKRSNNERLEFLGDAILSQIIAETLYRRFPEAQEGDLSRMRALLVKGETLAVMALDFQMGECLNLGSGELKSGGFRRESILSDAFEALIGAIYLDSDFAICQSTVLRWYQAKLDGLTLAGSKKDSKTRLQELLQARKLALPLYHLKQVSGEAHDQTFEVICEVAELSCQFEGIGTSRREAEQEAARQMLAALENKLGNK